MSGNPTRKSDRIPLSSRKRTANDDAVSKDSLMISQGTRQGNAPLGMRNKGKRNKTKSAKVSESANDPSSNNSSIVDDETEEDCNHEQGPRTSTPDHRQSIVKNKMLSESGSKSRAEMASQSKTSDVFNTSEDYLQSPNQSQLQERESRATLKPAWVVMMDLSVKSNEEEDATFFIVNVNDEKNDSTLLDKVARGPGVELVAEVAGRLGIRNLYVFATAKSGKDKLLQCIDLNTLSNYKTMFNFQTSPNRRSCIQQASPISYTTIGKMCHTNPRPPQSRNR